MPSRHYVPRWSEAVFAHWAYVRRDMVRCILHREIENINAGERRSYQLVRRVQGGVVSQSF
jgi:hypothetical protein